jgi:hypothetical protein
MSKLITFGCSLTEGAALPDIWVKDEHGEYYTSGPSKFAWPAVLGSKLNLQVDNKGRSGSSNKLIWLEALAYKDYSPSDVVVFLWSHMPRYTIITNYERIYNSNKNPTLRAGDVRAKIIKNKDKRKQATLYFKHIYNEFDMQLELYGKMNHVDLHIKNNYNCKKVVHLLQWDFNKLSVDWNNIDVPSIHMGEYREKFPLGLDNVHPSIETHEHFATDIYNWIKNENIL